MLRKAAQIAIKLFIVGFILSGCTSKLELEKQLVGSWQGLNSEDGFSWCFDFNEDLTVEIWTWQKPFGDSWESNWMPSARATRHQGKWAVADGRRVMLDLGLKVDIDDRSEQALNLPVLQFPAFYIIGEIEQESLRMTSHHRGKEGSWMESTATAACDQIEPR